MEENIFWIWLVMGFIPFRIERTWSSVGKQKLEARALFWVLVVTRRYNMRRKRRWKQRTNYVLRIPVIDRLKEAAWAAVVRFTK